MKPDKVYTVRLVRPVLQSAVVVVEASDADTALKEALQQSESLAERDWSAKRSSDNAYGVHAEAIVNNQDVFERTEDPDRALREFRNCEGLSDAVRYLLLAVDTQSQTCNIIAQPWFLAMDAQTQANLSSAWMRLLSFVIENDGIDAKGWRTKGGQVDDDNVIAFPHADDGTSE